MVGEVQVSITGKVWREKMESEIISHKNKPIKILVASNSLLDLRIPYLGLGTIV